MKNQFIIFLTLTTFLLGQPFKKNIVNKISKKNLFKNIINHPNLLNQTEITTTLIHSDLYNSFLNKLPMHRKMDRQKMFEVGDTLSFFVRNIFDQSKWNRVLSKMIFDTTDVSIWIETQSKDSLLTGDELMAIIHEFKSYLFEKSGVNNELKVIMQKGDRSGY